jgi:putative RecB family exonuclease
MNCPLLYRFRVIDKLPEPPSADALKGTLVHSVLEHLFGLERQSRTPNQAHDSLPSIWAELKEKTAGVEEMFLNVDLEQWLISAHALLDRYFELEDPKSFDPTDLEKFVEYQMEDGPMIHGYIDRLDIAPTGEIRVVDYKTGKSPRAGYEEKSLFQMRFYALILWRTLGKIPKRLQLLYLGDKNRLLSEPTEAELIKTEGKILSIWSDIQLSHQTGLWKPKKSKLCDWCNHQSICPEFGGTPPPIPEQSLWTSGSSLVEESLKAALDSVTNELPQ